MEEFKFIFEHLTEAAKSENSMDKIRFIITRTVSYKGILCFVYFMSLNSNLIHY